MVNTSNPILQLEFLHILLLSVLLRLCIYTASVWWKYHLLTCFCISLPNSVFSDITFGGLKLGKVGVLIQQKLANYVSQLFPSQNWLFKHLPANHLQLSA